MLACTGVVVLHFESEEYDANANTRVQFDQQLFSSVQFNLTHTLVIKFDIEQLAVRMKYNYACRIRDHYHAERQR